MKTYTISELAREFQVTPRALRFYEDKGLLSPTRDGLNRVYSTRDRARLKLILQGKSVGFSLSDIREILDFFGAVIDRPQGGVKASGLRMGRMDGLRAFH